MYASFCYELPCVKFCFRLFSRCKCQKFKICLTWSMSAVSLRKLLYLRSLLYRLISTEHKVFDARPVKKSARRHFKQVSCSKLSIARNMSIVWQCVYLLATVFPHSQLNCLVIILIAICCLTFVSNTRLTYKPLSLECPNQTSVNHTIAFAMTPKSSKV